MRLPLGLELDKDCKVGLRLLRAGPGQQSIIAYARTRSEQRTALRTFFFPCWLSLERFERVVRSASRVERLYFAYGDASLDPVFFHVPDRERFKLLYGVLLQKKDVFLKRDLEGLHRRTGMSKRMITFILKVFA